MNKEKSISILEEILEKANECDYLWEGNPSIIQRNIQENFPFNKDNKLRVFEFSNKYQHEKVQGNFLKIGGYISITQKGLTLDKNKFSYFFDGNFFPLENRDVSANSEEVYETLKRVYRTGFVSPTPESVEWLKRKGISWDNLNYIPKTKTTEEVVHEKILEAKKDFDKYIQSFLEINNENQDVSA